MLCSDGMWGLVTADDIVNEIKNSPNPEAACQKLVEKANAAGGPDNITIVIIRIPD